MSENITKLEAALAAWESGTQAPDDIDELRAIRDRLGKYGDLFMRLSGFYWVGPRDTAEPEFGYRDMRGSSLRQSIQQEAADALAELSMAHDARGEETPRGVDDEVPLEQSQPDTSS